MSVDINHESVICQFRKGLIYTPFYTLFDRIRSLTTTFQPKLLMIKINEKT
jgi:hypothetical protein